MLVKEGWHFFADRTWDPVADDYGALAPIIGTLTTSLIALLLAVPTSFGIAMFLTEVAPPWLRTPVATAIDLLASIPSIIYGMWGLFVFVPFMAELEPGLTRTLGRLPFVGVMFQGPPLGLGVLTAGIVLAVMILPFICAVMRDAFASVPTRLKESAFALGATRWEVVWHIVLPQTRSAAVGGVFLGLGRALGETMAVTMVIGNSNRISASLLVKTKTAVGPSSLVYVSPLSLVGDVLTLMQERALSLIPVLEDGRPVGSLRENRLLTHVLANRELLAAPVSAVMDASFPVIDDESTISEVARLLQSSPAILVEEYGRIAGILTRHDLLDVPQAN